MAETHMQKLLSAHEAHAAALAEHQAVAEQGAAEAFAARQAARAAEDAAHDTESDEDT